jgi:hypothetical protein
MIAVMTPAPETRCSRNWAGSFNSPAEREKLYPQLMVGILNPALSAQTLRHEAVTNEIPIPSFMF